MYDGWLLDGFLISTSGIANESFAGLKSKLDIGVMEAANRETHFFVNVADIHL